MKRKIIFILLFFIATSLCSGYTVNELYRKINNYENRHLFLYEAFDEESKDFIFYELETNETKKGVKTIYRLRSADLEKLKRFIIYLQKNYDDKKYSETILDYAENNKDLVFLWDRVELDQSVNTEIFCYKLE